MQSLMESVLEIIFEDMGDEGRWLAERITRELIEWGVTPANEGARLWMQWEDMKNNEEGDV